MRPKKRASAVAALLVGAATMVPMGPAAAADRCHGRRVTHEGTDGDDVIKGTGKDDVVWAGPGNDRIETFGGSDVVCASRGHDVVLAGIGDDKLWGGRGNDRIKAARGHDFVYGERGADRIQGGDQSDEIHGHAGPDRIHVGNSVTARGAGDKGYGGVGRDRLVASGDEIYTYSTKLYGNKGPDTLIGEQKGHVLDGGQGTDVCSREASRKNCERRA